VQVGVTQAAQTLVDDVTLLAERPPDQVPTLLEVVVEDL
jgi:hypothetical protein